MPKTNYFVLILLLFNFSLNAQTPVWQFFEKTEDFLQKNVEKGLVNYSAIKQNSQEILTLAKQISELNTQQLTKEEKQAFLINAYNLTVIKSVVLDYPIASVEEIAGFFSSEKHNIAGKKMTLNDLENKELRPLFDFDPRLHFVLVCGALGCPPIISEAYTSQNTERLLNLQAAAAVGNPLFTKVTDEEVQLSKIFEWYAEDFGGSKKQQIEFLNTYLNTPIDKKAKVSYYPYDWSLNEFVAPAAETSKQGLDVPNLSSNLPSAMEKERFIVSALYDKGEMEINWFNNIYVAKNRAYDANGFADGFSSRQTFASSLFQFLFGISPRVNVGFDLRVRSVTQNNTDSKGHLDFLNVRNEDKAENGSYARFGVPAIGPKVKYTPFKKFGNISVQHTLYLPIMPNLESNDEGTAGFLDWQGTTIINQFFYDQNIGDKFAIFAEVDLNAENFSVPLGKKDGYWQLSTPMTIIPSYFPDESWVFYGLVGSAPQWGFNQRADENTPNERFYVPFNQYGAGVKYLLTRHWQLEMLYTRFVSSPTNVARTFNFGVRYIGR